MVEAAHRSALDKKDKNADFNQAQNHIQKTPPQQRKPSDPNSASAKKRRKVNHACIYCRRSHMTCDLERPCTRCIKRNIGHLCHDEPREPSKKNKQEPGFEDGPIPMPDTNMGGLGQQGRPINGLSLSMPQPDHNIVQPTPVHTPHPSIMSGGNMGMLGIQDWMYSPHGQLAQNMHTLHPSYMFNTTEVSNEYSLLNDFVSNSLLDETMFGTEDQNMAGSASNTFNTSLNSGNAFLPNTTQAPTHMPPPAAIGKEIVRPSSGFPIDKSKMEQFSLIAADPAGTDAPELRLRKLLQAKYDAGLLRPFNYVKGYERMYKYMKAHLRRESIAIISKQIEQFRPIFRERVALLQDIELVYVEIEFEKLLMKYDRVFASMAIPACCWRRTGEIYRGNKEMAELANLPMESLRDGKTAIHDIFAEKGLVKYWKEFGKIAFVESQKAMISSIILKRTREDGKYEEIECCFSFTIQRDKHNIPFLVIGNFLKIIPPGS